MWETIKSIAFVITTVMVALILQARANSVPSISDQSSASQEEISEQLDFASSLPSHFQKFH